MACTSIRPLSDHLINQIAAGEVIERPASVVKELVENSLDADARRVDVEVSGGGVQSIVVRDDGAGIEGGEIHAALARHCTSKIGGDNDLAAIATLGFRGEALASVGAVADIEIATRAVIDRHGWQVVAAARAAAGATHCASTRCRHLGNRARSVSQHAGTAALSQKCPD